MTIFSNELIFWIKSYSTTVKISYKYKPIKTKLIKKHELKMDEYPTLSKAIEQQPNHAKSK